MNMHVKVYLFHWLVKIEGDKSMCLQFKEREKFVRGTCPCGAQGSIELNINSSLCFGKNSQLSLKASYAANYAGLSLVVVHNL